MLAYDDELRWYILAGFWRERIINSFVSYTIRGELKSRQIPELSQEFPRSSEGICRAEF